MTTRTGKARQYLWHEQQYQRTIKQRTIPENGEAGFHSDSKEERRRFACSLEQPMRSLVDGGDAFGRPRKDSSSFPNFHANPYTEGRETRWKPDRWRKKLPWEMMTKIRLLVACFGQWPIDEKCRKHLWHTWRTSVTIILTACYVTYYHDEATTWKVMNDVFDITRSFDYDAQKNSKDELMKPWSEDSNIIIARGTPSAVLSSKECEGKDRASSCYAPCSVCAGQFSIQ